MKHPEILLSLTFFFDNIDESLCVLFFSSNKCELNIYYALGLGIDTPDTVQQRQTAKKSLDDSRGSAVLGPQLPCYSIVLLAIQRLSQLILRTTVSGRYDCCLHLLNKNHKINRC